jgi:hypothetical protein
VKFLRASVEKNRTFTGCKVFSVVQLSAIETLISFEKSSVKAITKLSSSDFSSTFSPCPVGYLVSIDTREATMPASISVFAI